MRVRVKNHTLLRLGAVRPQHIDGRKTGWRDEHESVYADAEAHGWDAASTVRAMDVEGLDLAVMFPSRGLFVLGLDSSEHIGSDGLEPAYASAIAKAYNDWLADYCKESPDRMFGAAMVAPHDVDGRRPRGPPGVEELGLQGGVPRPGLREQPAVAPPRLRPAVGRDRAPRRAAVVPRRRADLPHAGLLAAAARQADALAHVQPAAGHPVRDGEPVRRRRARAVPEPALSRSSRATARGRPWLLDRLDEHFEWTGWYEGTDLTMKPSDYFRRQCFLGVEAEESTATQYVDWFGDDNLVFSTDYPHGDSQFPHAVDTFDKLAVHGRRRRPRSAARTGSASTRSRSSSTPALADGRVRRRPGEGGVGVAELLGDV